MSVVEREFADLGLDFGPTALELPDFLDFDDWSELLRSLVRAESSFRWWIGDAINYGDRTYGDTYTQAFDATGLAYDTLVSYAYVARAVESSTRVENLSWSHHRAVAKLDPVEQELALRKAIDEDWTVALLSEYVRGDQEPPVEPAGGNPAARAERVGPLERVASVATALLRAATPDAGNPTRSSVPAKLLRDLEIALGEVPPA